MKPGLVLLFSLTSLWSFGQLPPDQFTIGSLVQYAQLSPDGSSLVFTDAEGIASIDIPELEKMKHYSFQYPDGHIVKSIRFHPGKQDQILIRTCGSCANYNWAIFQSMKDDMVFLYSLSTFDVSFTHPELQGLAYETLEGLLDDIPSRQKVLFMDACHSGELDEALIEEMKEVRPQNQGDVAQVLDKANRGLTPISTPTANNIDTESYKLIDILFANTQRGNGTTIISAAAGTEFALEKGELENGVFTYSILEAFKQNSTLSINELKNYVEQRVMELTLGMQRPTSRRETFYYDWLLLDKKSELEEY